jgi:hypothetical protein
VFDGKHISNFDNTSGWKTLNSIDFSILNEKVFDKNPAGIRLGRAV